ncbi:serine/threonine protein kinase [Dulcicalothrix desertica PCC 7102]|uniref:Serine/threonine protein kinase n=1 Tax=Dulcicalothrix desertica PCC 7102 TaxID=232991 RepID=A0A3S1BZK2_9CYAN|nr:serine/threonine-protein kinase [Dulcicalothrix desertica]RUS97551.1 serine/threonine protein kinase [Dulcicalothrix desertica PCC 7102]TWH54762.1 serine/threonine protein kinase [Dulcicalothrix desertica PCC 7102]
MNNEVLNDRYKIIYELGRQTGRRTLLAQDLESNSQVVVKVLYLGKDFDWQELKLFQREAETLKTLNHPAIPQYLDYFEFDTLNDKGFGLVQTYVDAKSLEQHVEAGRRFSTTEVKELARTILEILTYLHDQEPPIIHRDIKPSNILLTNRSGNSVGQVYLVDFGSVQNIAAQEGGTITVVGTYGYMPPEQFGGRTKPASDLYSLGATMIYLVTGMHPTELPQQDLQIQFRKFADINPEFADWLEWLTEPSLNKRFSSAHLALEVINNPPPRMQAIITQQLLDKPYNTQIALKKTDENVEIIIKPKGFSVGLISFISILTPFSVGIHSQEVNIFNLFELLMTQRSISVWGSLYLIFQLFTFAILVRLILVALFKETHVLITAQDVTIIHKILWFKRHRKYFVNTSTKSEVKIISNLNYEQFKFELLLMVSGIKVLNFNNHTNLSDYESKWLVQEIGNWLTKSAE